MLERFASTNEFISLQPGPALADAGPNARPGRGAQCKS